jgi:hypothetical protein
VRQSDRRKEAHLFPFRLEPDLDRGGEKNPHPFLKAFEEVRHLATREGWRYQHVQAIIVAIDQYAEAATAIASSS